MFIFGYYIEKKNIYLVIGIIAAIIIAIISVNMRISKNQNGNQTYVGFVNEDGTNIVGSDIDAKATVVIYDYDEVFKYFSSAKDALEFREYLADYVASSGTLINEWWVTNVTYNEAQKEITFSLRTNGVENFFVRKNNEKTYISYTHE